MEEKKLYTSLKQYQNRFLRQKAIGNLFFTKNSTTTNRSIIDLYQLLFTNFAEPQQEFQNFLTGSVLKLKEINAYSIPNIDLHLKVLYSSEDDKVFMHKYRELSTKSNIFKVKPIFEEIIKFYKRKNKDNPEDLVNKTIKFLNSYFAEQFDNLKIIVKDSENELSEKGNNVFYLGYPYIEGFLETEEVFRGPLLLWPIVVDNNDKVKREMTLRIETTNVIINPMIKLRQLAARKINLDLVNFDPLDDEEDINKIEKALTELSEIGFTFKNNNPTVVSQTSIITNFSLPLKAYNKEQATSELKNKYNFNESAILCAAFIGIYKTTNTALFSDYNKILENTNLGELNDLFFQILNEYEDSKEKRIEFEKSFREQDVIAISELDFYQKLAIKKAMNSNLIIEGPPGTGKSQTITNLIVNDIYRGDNVLLCAEKKTALEVVYNNMKKFQKYCLFIDDMNNKSFVFSQIKAAIDSSLNTVVSEKQKISNDEMDYYFDKIREYRQLIEEEKTQNYTLYKNDLKDINNYLDPNYYERLNQYAIFSLALESFTEGVEKIYANLDDIIKIKEFKQKFAVLIELHYKKINFLKLSKLLTKIKDKKLDYLIYNMLAKGEIKPKINLTKDYDDYVNFLSEASSKITKLKTELESLDEFLAGLVLLKLETNFDPIITDNYPFIDFLLESQLAKDHLIILYKWIYIKNFENNNEDMIGIANSVWHKEIKEIEIKSINVAIDQLDNNLAIDIREKIQSLGSEIQDQIMMLKKVVNNNSRKSLKFIFSNYPLAIHTLFPVLMMTPDSAAILLETKPNLFNQVIFDEASQLFVEKTIPIIYRGQRIVVAGDSKQLRPTNFFGIKNTGEEETEDFNDNLEAESLLDFVNGKIPSRMLRYHYRSVHKELINFSNTGFYTDQLFTNSNTKLSTIPIEEIYLPEGKFINRQNRPEAEAVVNKIEEILETRKHNETIGVITFNVEQSVLIQSLLDKRAQNNKKLADELNRIVDRKNYSIFVKNLENVQGDERDIILFSFGFAKNENGVFRNYFGPLSDRGGENRLNVAITRAKRKIYLVKSIKSYDISKDSKNKGPKFLHYYLKYVEALNNPNIEPELRDDFLDNVLGELRNEETGNNVIESEVVEVKTTNPEFQAEVLVALDQLIQENGYGKRFQIKQQIKVDNYLIDIGIYDKKEQKFVLGIEIDGEHYNKTLAQKEYDFYRQKYLEVRNWEIYRIPLLKWEVNREKVLRDIALKMEGVK